MITGLPEAPPVASRLGNSVRADTLVGGSRVKVIVWAIRGALTVIVCWAWGAGWYCALPAWLASMTQLPCWLKVTVEPESEHTEVLEESMVKVTGLPEAPPDAATS